MLDKSFCPGPSHGSGDLFRVRLFLDQHGPALEAAAGLLGGEQWARRVLQLRRDVSDGILPLRAGVRELCALGRLLRLENTGDSDAEESAAFVPIDPADPQIHELCLLSEHLDRCLVEIFECGAHP